MRPPTFQPNADVICLGEIVGVQGLKGQLRIKTFTEQAENLTAYGDLFNDQGKIFSLKIDQLKSQTLIVASLKGCSDRNQAEALVGTKLYVNREQLTSVLEDEFYYHDLIGMTVLDERDKVIGTVKNVENYGAGDFLEIVDDQQKNYTLPFNKKSVSTVDNLNKRIIIQSQFLLS